MAAQAINYKGQGLSLLRDKNRFVLPNCFRSTLRESSGGNVVCLASHDRWPCLIGFGRSRVDNFKAELDELRDNALRAGRTDFDGELLADAIMSALEVPFDDSGRFVLPAELAGIGNISDTLYFRGNMNFFTVWSPDNLYAMGDAWKVAQVACQTLVAQETAKAKRK